MLDNAGKHNFKEVDASNKAEEKKNEDDSEDEFMTIKPAEVEER